MISEISKTITMPLTRFLPCPPSTDRKAWGNVPREIASQLVENGEAHLGRRPPVILATDFMDFCRTGDRERYQTLLFERRTTLNDLILAECVEGEGRFLDDIINYVFLICGESAWQLPAHNSYIRDTPQFILPDVTRPVVDLFAAETGAVLGVAEYLLRDAFADISPAVSTVVNENLEKRIFRPYLEEHFWWMGDGESHMNNWTSWCTQNVLLAAFTRETPHEREREMFEKACKSLDYFLDEYGVDGCCDEGAQYYRHAGLTLFNALDVLNGITGDAFVSVYRQEKVRNIASYILNAHVDGEYYVNFADCSPVAGRCNAREFLFGKRTGNPKLMAFAAADYQASESPLLPEEHSLFYRLQTIFTHQEMMSYDRQVVLSHPDMFYPSAGLFITRDDNLYLAVKAGDNDDSHNHNDTGSFTIYKNGRPLFIDIGVETYSKKTFSPERYTIWTMQSRYHNLPTFGDVTQLNGPEYRADDVSYQLNDTFGQISMDIAAAYPDENIRSYRRLARLDKGETGMSDGCITITDTYDGATRPVVLSLMTYEEPTLQGSTLQIGALGTCQIEGASAIRTEIIPITDARLKLAWKHDVYRTLVTMDGNQLVLRIK